MGTYKVCVYAICKNEEKFADRWMDSMGEADLVVDPHGDIGVNLESKETPIRLEAPKNSI